MADEYDDQLITYSQLAMRFEEYVKSLHNCKYFDISCKTAYNVDKVIQVVNELEVQSNEDETEEVKEKEKKSCAIF